MASIPALDRVDDTVRRRSTDLVELSHAIHAEPELAFAEHRSCAKAQTLVAERGFEITAAAGGLDTAFRADFGSGPLTVGDLRRIRRAARDRSCLRPQHHCRIGRRRRAGPGRRRRRIGFDGFAAGHAG